MTTISSISCFWFLNEQANFFLYFSSTINEKQNSFGFFLLSISIRTHVTNRLLHHFRFIFVCLFARFALIPLPIESNRVFLNPTQNLRLFCLVSSLTTFCLLHGFPSVFRVFLFRSSTCVFVYVFVCSRALSLSLSPSHSACLSLSAAKFFYIWPNPPPPQPVRVLIGGDRRRRCLGFFFFFRAAALFTCD